MSIGQVLPLLAIPPFGLGYRLGKSGLLIGYSGALAALGLTLMLLSIPFMAAASTLVYGIGLAIWSSGALFIGLRFGTSARRRRLEGLVKRAVKNDYVES